MKRLMSITITLLFSFAFVFAAIAAGNGSGSVQYMTGPGHHGPWYPPEPNPGDPSQPGPGYPGQPNPENPGQFNPGYGGHYGHNHENIKIADLYLDGDPEIIILEDGMITVMHNEGEVLFTKTAVGIESGYQGGEMMPGYGNYHNGGVTLEVTDFDGDRIPEIIILDTEKITVLDNNGDHKTTITLP